MFLAEDFVRREVLNCST